VLYGLNQQGDFAKRWSKGSITESEVPALAAHLEAVGARTFTLETANRLTNQALNALESACPQGEAGDALRDLAWRLVGRQS